MLLAAILLLWDLGGRALWWDEIINVGIDRHDLRSILVNLHALPGEIDPVYADVRPPLFHFIQHFWLGVAGASDLAVRLPNVFFALMALYLLYRLGRHIDGATTGVLAVLVAAISPFWLLYARMARYYALTAALAVASVLLFIELLKSPSRLKWLAYFVLSVMMLYTDYLIATVFICQALYLLWARPPRRWLITWAGTLAAVGLTYLPWLPAWRTQSALMSGAGADLSSGLIGTLLKFAFPLSSFTVGETVFPWEIPAILGYLCFGALFAAGIFRLWRQPAPANWPGLRLPFALLFTLIPTVGTIALITFVTPMIPFIGIANRTFFAFPFVALLAGVGLRALRCPAIRAVAAVVLIAVLAYPVANYYAGRHFVNPVYAVPTETVISDILAQAQPGDAIFSDLDTGFGYYFEQQAHPGLTHYYNGSPEAMALLEDFAASLKSGSTPQSPRIFMLTFGRDRTRFDAPEVFTRDIQPKARIVWERGYAPQDETYRAIKQRLLGREDYRYKLLVQLYEPPR